MANDAPQSQPQPDPDLVRWARELGVAYDELVSTLNYAGPAFKDSDAVSPEATPVSPKDTPAP